MHGPPPGPPTQPLVSHSIDVDGTGWKSINLEGVDGGAVVEPLNDLVGVLATLVDSRGMVLVPDFYADVEEVGRPSR